MTLSDEGKRQAHEAGIWLANYCQEQEICIDNARIWRSPYCRTRQTSEEFNASLNISDIKEDITLIEQQFGLFDSIPKEKWGELFPREYEEYQRQRNNYGKLKIMKTVDILICSQKDSPRTYACEGYHVILCVFLVLLQVPLSRT